MKRIVLVLAIPPLATLHAQRTPADLRAQRPATPPALRYLRRHLGASNTAFSSTPLCADLDGDALPDVVVPGAGRSELFRSPTTAASSRAPRTTACL